MFLIRKILGEGRIRKHREIQEITSRQEESGRVPWIRKGREAHPEQGDAGRMRETPTRTGRCTLSRYRQEEQGESGRCRENEGDHPGTSWSGSHNLISLFLPGKGEMPSTALRGKWVLTLFPEFLRFLKT
jgi:hypothetical protein